MPRWQSLLSEQARGTDTNREVSQLKGGRKQNGKTSPFLKGDATVRAEKPHLRTPSALCPPFHPRIGTQQLVRSHLLGTQRAVQTRPTGSSGWTWCSMLRGWWWRPPLFPRPVEPSATQDTLCGVQTRAPERAQGPHPHALLHSVRFPKPRGGLTLSMCSSLSGPQHQPTKSQNP